MNSPLDATVPPLAFHATDVLLVPLTLALNCWLLPPFSDAALGSTATETVTGADAPEPKADTLQVAQRPPVVQEGGSEVSPLCALVSLLQNPRFESWNRMAPLPLPMTAIQ